MSWPTNPAGGPPGTSRRTPALNPDAATIYYLVASGYQISWDGTTVAFAIEGGATLWWVTAAEFASAAGSTTAPSLTFTVTTPQPTVTQLQVELSGARWPGTEVAADFTFTCTYSTDRVLNAQVNNITQTWLAGGVTYNGTIYAYPETGLAAGSFVPPQAPICTLGSFGSIDLVAGVTAAATFKPGVLTLSGSGIATISGVGATLTADALSLEISSPDGMDPFFDDAPSLDSMLTLTSDDFVFDVAPQTLSLGILEQVSNQFQQFVMGAGEDPGSAPRQQFAQLISSSADAQFTLALDASVGIATPAPVATIAASTVVFDFAVAGAPVGIYGVGGVPATFWAGGDGVWLRFPATRAGQGDTGVSLAIGSAPPGLQSVCTLISDLVSLPYDDVALQSSPQVVGFRAPGKDVAESVVQVGGAISGPRVSLFQPTLGLIRPADLLVVQLAYQGVRLQSVAGGQPQMVMAVPDQAGLLVATFQPQHIAEATSAGGAPTPAPVRMTGPSRLAYTIPQGTPAFAADIDSLFDWAAFVPIVVGSGETAAPPQAPTPIQTAIELPYRLFVAPGGGAGWAHSPSPASNVGPVPLWQTRLAALASGPDGPFVDERDTTENRAQRQMAAIWSPDYQAGLADALPSPALTAAQRSQIVVNGAVGPSGSPALSLAVDHCALSALGGWADYSADWSETPTQGGLVAGWRHVVAQGRDQYVRVVEHGYLFPWGHAASWVTVSERKFDGSADNTARLTQTNYIVVTQPMRDLGLLAQMPTGGRDVPYTRIESLTSVTPPIVGQAQAQINGSGAYWVQLPTSPVTAFQFHFRGWDRETSGSPEGRASTFSAPVIFIGVASGAAAAPADAIRPADSIDGAVQTAIPAFNNAITAAPLNLAGQAIAYAEPNLPGDTTHPTSLLTMLSGDARQGATSWVTAAGAAFYPTLQSAAVTLPALTQLAGADAQDAVIGYAGPYLTQAFDSNPGEVYATLANSIVADFTGQNANGVVAPSMSLTALSRAHGVLPGDPLSALAGHLNPADFLQSDATVLGLFNLKDLLTDAIDLASAPADQVPGFTMQQNATDITLSFTWNSDLPSPGPIISFPTGSCAFSLQAVLISPIGQTAAPTATTKASITAFQLNLPSGDEPLLVIAFNALTFTEESGKKPDVQLGLQGIQLGGQIDFLEPIMEAGQALLGDAPSIDTLPDSIEIDFSAGLPSVDLGVFSLLDIRVNSAVVLSLQSDPVTLELGFSDREHPFTLAVELIGGGGWFNIAIAGGEVTEIDFALQAGAYVSLDLGIASGSVSILLGVAFTFTGGGDAITGYVRACGQVTVLQLITIYAEFYLGLTYLPDENKIWGEADLTLEISIAFFSKSVTLTMRREFHVPVPLKNLAVPAVRAQAALPPAPGVADIMPDATYWQAYAGAFV